jgi:hypothetical protein
MRVMKGMALSHAEGLMGAVSLDLLRDMRFIMYK